MIKDTSSLPLIVRNEKNIGTEACECFHAAYVQTRARECAREKTQLNTPRNCAYIRAHGCSNLVPRPRSACVSVLGALAHARLCVGERAARERERERDMRIVRLCVGDAPLSVGSRESPTADGWRHSAGCYRCLRTSLAISGCLSAASN